MKKNYALLTLAALFLAACTAGTDGEVSADPNSGIYRITTVVEKKDEGASAHTSKPKANAGDRVTLTVIPPEPAIPEEDGGEGGSADPVPWFVEEIKGSYTTEDSVEKRFTAFSPSAYNEWTFKMPGGDLTIEITFTADPDLTTAYLQDLSSSAGAIEPSFERDKYAYTIIVPFGTNEFSIFAPAENPYVKPVLTKTGSEASEYPEDGLLGADLIAPPDSGEDAPFYCLKEGLNKYTVTVISGDTLTRKDYNITVILLPDLSLSEFKVIYNDGQADIERDLAPLASQTVYVPATAATVKALPSDESITGIEQMASDLKLFPHTPVTLTVRKPLTGVSNDYTEKAYTVNLYYGENLNPIAEGGFINFIPDGAGGFYETHTFTESGTLSVKDTSVGQVNAGILLVGGGGGGGRKANDNRADYPGGGGAGGLLYKAGYNLTLTGGSILAIVGLGGEGGASSGAVGGGNNGEDSWLGAAANSKILSVPGGGGGGGSGDDTDIDGKKGGSGGGGGGGGGSKYGEGGAGKYDGAASISDSDFHGSNGGSGGGAGSTDAGGGGGGAGGPGGAAYGKGTGTPGDGGAGWKPADATATRWISDLTGVTEFSRGGIGGNGTVDNGKNFGDGGSGGTTGNNRNGGSGHNGIVIIRFPHNTAATAGE